MNITDTIKQRLKESDTRYWAGDNISQHIKEGEHQLIIDELTPKFEAVLDSLIIDRHNDPNSQDRGRRMAKMYVNELMRGRYVPLNISDSITKEMRRNGTINQLPRGELRKLINQQRKRKFGEQAQQPAPSRPAFVDPFSREESSVNPPPAPQPMPMPTVNQASIFPTFTQPRAPGPVDPSLLGDNPVTAALNAQIANRRG